jgi:hypothetical protein
MRLERVPVNHVNRTAEQAGDKFFQTNIFVDRPFAPGSNSTRISMSLSGWSSPRAIEPNTAARRIPRARKAGSACFSLAMTSSRRMATSYQNQALHSSIGILPRLAGVPAAIDAAPQVQCSKTRRFRNCSDVLTLSAASGSGSIALYFQYEASRFPARLNCVSALRVTAPPASSKRTSP